ncbi:MAG: hypothetical protein QG577_1251, partial [Thermodesulfobacteriota bacterium]|nr:hypothetical protein [Thermodesulfobacteriota bacterium]
GVSPSVNPEPLALFFDAIFIGEIPEANDEQGFLDVLAKIWGEKGVRRSGDRSRLAELRDEPGIYLPEAYHFSFREQGPIAQVEAAPFHPFPVKAVKRMNPAGTVPAALVDDPAAVFDAALLMEINRGCGRGCRFCSSGWIHRPVRHCSFQQFLSHICPEDVKGRTVGLIGSDLAGHPELMEILSYLLSLGAKFSLSSIRPEGLTHELISMLRATGQKTVTLAPETASLRMKKIIGKTIPEELFFEKINLLVSNGIPNIRLYFMVGLPSETDDDVLALVDFVLKAREVFVDASRPLKRIGTMGVQLNPFVPKPWTPFQCVGMQPPKVIEKKLNIVRKGLGNTPNVRVRAESVREAVMQGLFSRADRRIAGSMYESVVRSINLSRLLKSVGWYLDFFLYRERNWDELFPWDVVDHGIDKTVLRRVFENALPSETKVSGG